MKPFTIIISKRAEKDLFELFTYIAENDLPSKASILVKALIEKSQTLSQFPERGRHVYNDEGIDYYEIYYKAYRIIYSITDDTVTIAGIVDSRRNLEKLLPQRLSSYCEKG